MVFQLQLMVHDFCHQWWDTEIAQNILRLLKPTDMTIHFRGETAFSVFSSKNLIPYLISTD
jgi:hypothetical protein